MRMIAGERIGETGKSYHRIDLAVDFSLFLMFSLVERICIRVVWY